MATLVEIQNGPSKYDLMISLFERSMVEFKFIGYIQGADGKMRMEEKTIQARVAGVESGASGFHDWHIVIDNMEGSFGKLECCYSTQTRRGKAEKFAHPNHPLEENSLSNFWTCCF